MGDKGPETFQHCSKIVSLIFELIIFSVQISEVEITKDDEVIVPREIGMSELSGNESQDAATVCRWFASR